MAGQQQVKAGARRGRDEARRITAFWDWWDEARGRVAEAFDEGALANVEAEITAAVGAIHPALEWDVAPGDEARRRLCLSGQSDPELRALLERWWQAGPEDDDEWETHPARAALPPDTLAEMAVDLDGRRIALAETEVQVKPDEERERLDLLVYHPAFAELDDEQMWDVLSSVLDHTLGEDEVERWVGAVGPSAEPLDDARPLFDLPSITAALAERATGDHWSVLKGKAADGVPVAAVVNRALKRIDFPDCEHHVAVRLTPDLGVFGELGTHLLFTRLDDVEESLLEGLGDDAVYVGRETRMDRLRRTLHLYTSRPGPIVARVKAWAADHPEWGAGVDTTHDPGWDAVDHILK